MQINELYQIYLKHPSVVTDTRKIIPGDLFFALKGSSFNGNEYAQEALLKGAAWCIVDELKGAPPEKTIRVKNVLETLQQLALHHRRQFHIPFIAITGSNGKTTTKELVHAVLSAKYITSTTEGNLNNHIGIPLTLLKIKAGTEMAVIEMGANHRQEIAGYCLYTEPTHGLITNCGKAHIEGFGGEEGVKKGKGELFDYLRQYNGTAFIFNGQPCLLELGAGIRNCITYGSLEADHPGSFTAIEPFLEVEMNNKLKIKTQLIGQYNFPNVAAAVCIGRTFGISEADIKQKLEEYTPTNSRSQFIQGATNSIILDAYNANPSSMVAAIENFAAMKGDKKVLVLGAMMEMGKDSSGEHAAIVQLLAGFPWHQVILVGKEFENLPPSIQHFETSGQAAEWLRTQFFHNCQILIKGSRSTQMEKVLDSLLT